MDWRQFDRGLYALKLAELCRDLQKKNQNAAATAEMDWEWQRAVEGKDANFYVMVVDAYIQILHCDLSGIDRMCRDVWRLQGGTPTPEFGRRVIRDYAILGTIADRCGSIRKELKLMVRNKGFIGLAPALRHLEKQAKDLKTHWTNRLEVEARELEYKNTAAARPPRAASFPFARSTTKAAVENRNPGQRTYLLRATDQNTMTDANGTRKKPKPTEHRAMVEAYIEEVYDKTGERITKTALWKAARYKTRTEFERFERQDLKRPNKAANERFLRILREKPHLK
jgi:hypothetical protein